jgi:hypothetical protein
MRIDELKLDNRSGNRGQYVLIPPGVPVMSNDRARHDEKTSRYC